MSSIDKHKYYGKHRVALGIRGIAEVSIITCP